MVLNPFQVTQTIEKIQDGLNELSAPLHTNSFAKKPEMVEHIIKDIENTRKIVNELKEKMLSLPKE